MYLTKLYRYNKWLFAAIVFFVAMQLLITYKRGMVISPWYNYGMYSEKIFPQKEYAVNNKLGKPAWIYLVSPQLDDKVNVTIDNFYKQRLNDSLYQNEIVRLFQKAHLPKPNYKYYQSSFGWKLFIGSFESPLFQPKFDSIQKASPILFPCVAIWNGQQLSLQKSN